MSALAFVVLAFIVAMYALTDGYDLGIAIVAPFIARGERERGAVMHSIGPFWNGNEVWLITAGAVLFAFFPLAYASLFSGFYLPFMVVLWLLMFRGIALELRGHLESRMWHQFWDAAFSLSSLLLVALFGVAIGNLIRGVPLDESGYFTGTFAFLLNPYALGVGALAVILLAYHGCAFAMMRIDGPPAHRAKRVSLWLWPLLIVAYVWITFATFSIRHDAFTHGRIVFFSSFAVLIATLFSLGGAVWERGRDAFAGSSLFIAALLATAAATIYPYLVPAFPPASGGIAINPSAPPSVGLATALAFTIAGLILVVGYSIYVAARLAGKVRIDDD